MPDMWLYGERHCRLPILLTENPRTYNVPGRSDSDWTEYTGVKQSEDDKKNYTKIYQIFKNMK